MDRSASVSINGDSRIPRSSDKKIGLEQNAVTPAFLASSSISDQSYAVRMMIGFSSPMIPRILLTTSTPFISGISQSIIYAASSSSCSTASRVRSTASFPEVVQSGRIPIVDSILVTLEQVLKSSSTTSARSSFSCGITSCLTEPELVLKSSSTVNVEPFPSSLSTEIFPPIISTIFLVIAIPSPVPWIPLTVLVLSRSKGSKTCFWNSSLIPIPVSFTWNS